MRHNEIKQRVVALLVTVTALSWGHATAGTMTKTVTYTITSVESIDLNYNIVFTRSGNTPFDTSAPTTYTVSVPTSIIGQTTGGAGSFSVELADGFKLSLSWGAGSNVIFTSNCIYPHASNKYITYAVSCPDAYYYVTHVKMTGMESNYQYGMVQTYPGTGSIDTDYDNVWKFSGKYYSAASFGQVSVTYSDVPALSIFESDGENAYKIKSKDDLRHLANYVNNGNNDCNGLTFRQTQVITCDNTYTPIGDDDYYFRGTYDGQGHTVSGITVTSTGSDHNDCCIGLFGQVKGGTVQNVTLSNSSFTGKNNVGGIVGYNVGSTIENCRVESNVTIHAGYDNAEYLGGIAGGNRSFFKSGNVKIEGKIIGCVSAATVSKNSKSGCSKCGGIVGQNDEATVENCLYTGTTVSSDSYVGAIAGQNRNGTLTNNYYTDIDLGGVGSEGSSSDQNGARRARTVTLGENIVLVGDETAYNLSGLTAIGSGNYALSYNDGSTTTLYSGEGQTLTFNYTGAAPAEGYKTAVYANGVQATDNGNGTFTATMPAADAEVTISTIVTPWAGSGTPDIPWIIQYPSQLILLASNVNGGNNYEGKYFLQTADLIFDGTENNYISVGDTDHPFKGNYNGSGKTISRINIRKNYNSVNPSNSMSVGLFGRLDNGGVVDGVYLKNSTVVGSARVGGIVGWNQGGSVTNCGVESDVTIGGKYNNPQDIGGVVGLFDGGVIDNCFSAANVSGDGWTATNCGGIVGWFKSGNLRNCQVVGATINGSAAGAVVGYLRSDGSLSHNYYNACTVNETTTNIGCGYPPGYNNKIRDITNDDGAVQTAGIPLLDHSSNYYVINTYNGVANQNYTLAGRTLYKDGDWNTLCLPFSLSASQIAASDLAGADIRTLSSSSFANGTLTLNFTPAAPTEGAVTSISAGVPYIIKWDKAATNIVNPTFTGVTISKTTANVETTYVDFIGTYAPISYAEDNRSILLVGANSQLYYPKSGASLKAFRAYFQLKGITASDVQNARMNFVDETTSLNEELRMKNEEFAAAAEWFTLEGRKLDKQPTKKGLYIQGGHKVVIK